LYAYGQISTLRNDGPTPANATPRTYRVAQTQDLPAAFESFVAEHGRGGLKRIGKARMLGIAACIANGIQDAAGASLTSLPFTPERAVTLGGWRHPDAWPNTAMNLNAMTIISARSSR
jgi:CO/xanthine dehydrogenase Mo-binding subunit